MIANQRSISSNHISEGDRFLIDSRLAKIVDRSKNRIPKRNHDDSIPLSHSQESLWFFEKLNQNNPLYNMPSAFELRGLLDQGKLKSALNLLLSRHETLRTRIFEDEGTPRQTVLEQTTIELCETSLKHLLPQERSSELSFLLSNEAKRPFNLSKDLLLRAHLFRLEEQQSVLLITIHHIICDAWSMNILMRELSFFYNSLLENKSKHIAPLRIQFFDFINWQLSKNTSLENGLNYWKKRLQDIPEVTTFPIDRSRPSISQFQGKREHKVLPASLTEDLNALAHQEDCTVFALLLSAFNVLLHRYTMENDLLIGIPVASRNLKETEPLIGLFVNTIVFRTTLSGNPQFKDYIKEVKSSFLESYPYSDYPFEKLVEHLCPKRTSEYNPFIQTIFVLENEEPITLTLDQITTTPIDIYTETAKFDFVMHIAPRNGSYRCTVEYNKDLYTSETVQQILNHYQNLLQTIIEDPTQRISELSFLSKDEREKLVFGWNKTATLYPRTNLIHELFEEIAQEQPQATAVVSDNCDLSYIELNQKANQLARYLLKLNPMSGGVIGISLPRSNKLVISLLAILKAGCAYTYLDASLPAARLQNLIEDAQIKTIICDEAFQNSLKDFSEIRLIFINKEQELISKESSQNILLPGNSSTQLAYVSFTSGSTGRPKGVTIPHRAVVRLVKNTNYIQFSKKDVFLQLAPISFDASTFEIWGALLNGAKLVLYKDRIASISELGQFIEKHCITTLWLTSGLFNQIVDDQIERLTNVRYLLAGGDILSVPHVAKVLQHLDQCHLINGYGPTENATFTCCFSIDELPPNNHSIPIGRPISNTQVYILDKYLQPVPIGVPGELYIGGDGLSLGYLNQPELTKEKFIPNPFVNTPRDRLYKSGDRVRYLPNGNIEFLGRTDFQVKIRGFRIEPGDIASALSIHPQIKEAIVIPHDSPTGEKELCAYYTLKEKAQTSETEIKNFLKARLPEYMVPPYLMKIDSIPLNQNGKADLKSLPAPLTTRFSADQNIAPRDGTEEKLFVLWKNILSKEGFGIKNSFFDLGGHSLLAIRLVSDIEKAFLKKVTVPSIFQFPTIEEQAALLRGEKENNTHFLIVPIQPHGTKPPLFFIHGVGGGTLWGYSNLSKYFESDQPVYAFKSRGTEGLEEFKSIEEMAAAYISQLKIFQPQGPYYLSGYCFGGNIAFEMARQLQQNNDSVAFLGLMNCAAPNSSYTHFDYSLSFYFKFFQNATYWLRYMMNWESEQRRNFVIWKLRNWNRKLRSKMRLTPKEDASVDVEDLVDLTLYPEEQKKLWSAHLRALLEYKPKQYKGKVLLFRSPGHPLFCSFDLNNGWSEYCTELSLIEIPGAHETILKEPFVSSLAKTFCDYLQTAQRNSVIHKKPAQAHNSEFALCQGIHQLFEKRVKEKPDSIAVYHNEKTLSYQELNSAANRIAQTLLAKGIRSESRIAVFMERSPLLISALLGILKAGAAYVPIDPKYPTDRTNFILQDSGAKLVLIEKHLESKLANQTTEIIRVDDIDQLSKAIDSTSLNNFSINNLAYIIYTSGSTGKPKGVALEHRSVIHFLKWAQRIFSEEELAGVLASTSICFDLSIFEIFAPLSLGGRLILCENALQLPQIPHRHEVRLINTVPSAIKELVAQNAIPNGVITINLAGEPLSTDLVDKLYTLPHIRKVYDLYGPTETTVYSTFALRTPKGPATIGKPLDGEYVYILDKDFRPVPSNEIGEIYIGGCGLAREYLNRRDLTNERFCPNPFSNQPGHGHRMYKTGDLGRFLEDGSIQYLGRIDHQVKIRGFRIELNEIESALKAHPNIKEAVTIPYGLDEDKKLAAFIVSSLPKAPHQDIRKYLKDKLPDYMVPSLIKYIDQIPLTPNGKTDRKYLQVLAEEDISLEAGASARNSIEEKILKLWCDLLKREAIGIDQDFFELGGHSILAVRLVSEIEKTFGKKLLVTTLIENPTVRKFAEQLQNQTRPETELITSVQPHGKKPPIFWIHSLGGDGGGGFFYYRNIAQYLDPDQPSYGIRSPKTPLLSIEEMADRYIQELDLFYPKGPYLLGGFCFGGNVAFEMSRRLIKRGSKVLFLGLFESEAINVKQKYFTRDSIKMLSRSCRRACSDLLKNDLTTTLKKIQKKQRNAKKRIKQLFIRNSRSFNDEINRVEYPQEFIHYAEAHWEALMKHIPQPYDGHFTLFRSQYQPLLTLDPSLGWRNLARKGMTIKEIPGTHETMFFEPHVHDLARHVTESLNEAYKGL
jgi:amino acid adenylation domain-containing protein